MKTFFVDPYRKYYTDTLSYLIAIYTDKIIKSVYFFISLNKIIEDIRLATVTFCRVSLQIF